MAGLAGCGSFPPPVQYKDPLSGIMPVSTTAFTVDALVRVEQPAGLIVSDNTESYLQFEKGGDTAAHNYGPMTNDVAVRDMNPKSFVDRIIYLLRSRYPNIELIDDMNAAARLGKKTVFVIDVQPVYGRYSGQTTKFDLAVFVFDSQRHPISKITGYGEAVIPYPATDFRVKESSSQALQELDRKMSQYLR